MEWNFVFILNNALLGLGLAMDAFSVSVANGLNEPKMRTGKACLIAGTFAGFQFAMPMVGWVCLHTIVEYFKSFEKFIPWIALILLGYIGGKMIYEGLRGKNGDECGQILGIGVLAVQGVATSIDALTVGFTIAEYGCLTAIFASSIIAVVTFAVCSAGLRIGKKFGMKLADKAQLLGGVILVAIGIEIFVTSLAG